MRLQTLYYEHHLTKMKGSPILENPKWSQAQDVHDWRNYIDSRVKSIWHALDNEVRAAIALDALEEAGNEEWP